jgi:Domain of unknown function (DUF4349)
METQVRFLEELERDLMVVAELEGRRERKALPTRRSVRWKGWLGAVASLLVLAFAIGALAQLGGGGTSASSAGGIFSTVGSAVNRAGGAGIPNPGPIKAPDPARPASGQDGPTDLTKIVRDGTMALAVPDGSFEQNQHQVIAIAHANGGSILSSQTQGSTTGTLTLRIPAVHLDTAMLQLGRLGEVESSSVTGKDVTNQYVDLRAHLQNLIGRRTVLRRLLAQTNTIGESLSVYNELNGVQLQIDQIQGDLRFLDNQVAVSTLTVDLREESAPAGSSETNGAIHNPSLSRAWDRAIQGFFGIIATIIVGPGYLLPVAVVAGVVYGIVRLVRRRGRATS